MGKFDGMLLVSDYDDTLHYTSALLAENGTLPPVPPRNLEAIRYWMAEGGRFTIATGRALGAFLRQGRAVPVNAPCIVDNGASVYDMARERYVIQSFLPEGAVEQIAETANRFPGVSLELYHPERQPEFLRPVPWDWKHAEMAGMTPTVIERVDEGTVPPPLAKCLFVGDHEDLLAARGYMQDRDWGERYELIFSNRNLLEMTAKGANKGGMALRLKELCGCDRLYCAGDHANDLPMLAVADRGFAPANAAPEVLDSGATVVCHCLDGAIAEIVDLLEREAS